MKVGGKELSGLATSSVTLPRGNADDVVMTVYALPLGFEERAEGLFPSPVPPREFVTGPGGRILRDPKTKTPLVEANEDNHAYAKSSRVASRMQSVVWFYEAVKRGDVEFVTEEPTNDASDEVWCGFYQSIYRELCTAGFTIGDLNLMFKEISRISNLSDEAIGDAAEDFLSEDLREELETMR